MSDIDAIFDTGAFKSQQDVRQMWTPVAPNMVRIYIMDTHVYISSSQVPSPRPGQCAADTRTLLAATTEFVRRNPLMNDAVASYARTPLVVDNTMRSWFTQVT
jgi:hypothetical protein